MSRLWKWFFSRKKNDFEKMCDNLAEQVKGKLPDYDPIIYAEYFVKEYINQNKNGFVRIKAEANSIKHLEFLTSLVAIAGIGATILGVIVSVSDNYEGNIQLIVLAGLFIFVVGLLLGILKFKNVSVWQKYIIAVIEELEKERGINTNHE